MTLDNLDYILQCLPLIFFFFLFVPFPFSSFLLFPFPFLAPLPEWRPGRPPSPPSPHYASESHQWRSQEFMMEGGWIEKYLTLKKFRTVVVAFYVILTKVPYYFSVDKS